ncbi:hypothetical protein T484DRAFT_1754498 [Baffinella frigidus]|nr:hypothetical protein T484DRAFT_1754498 [Cryptophyta sp. CCMP2293]
MSGGVDAKRKRSDSKRDALATSDKMTFDAPAWWPPACEPAKLITAGYAKAKNLLHHSEVCWGKAEKSARFTWTTTEKSEAAAKAARLASEVAQTALLDVKPGVESSQESAAQLVSTAQAAAQTSLDAAQYACEVARTGCQDVKKAGESSKNFKKVLQDTETLEEEFDAVVNASDQEAKDTATVKFLKKYTDDNGVIIPTLEKILDCFDVPEDEDHPENQRRTRIMNLQKLLIVNVHEDVEHVDCIQRFRAFLPGPTYRYI